MSGTYTDLTVWQASMELAVNMYECSKTFPREENYGLRSQLRRAAVSVSSNIAEGKGRASDKELTHFLAQARGSLFEVETQIVIAERLGYVKAHERESILEQTSRVGKLLNGLIRSFRAPTVKVDPEA